MTAFPALAALALLFAAETESKPALSAVEVELDGPRIEVSFALQGAFDGEIVERIETGLPSGYDYQFRLVKDFKWWWDQEIESTEIQVFATYDAVSREYLVNTRQDGRLIESRVLRSLEELEAAMTTFDGLHVFTVTSPPAKRRLLIKARAKLGDKTILKIIPSTASTGWVETRKFRVPGDPAGP